MGSFPSVEYKTFIGLNTGKDKLSLMNGQLSLNYNYLYMPTGGLEERGGGALLKAPPAAGKLYSLANFEGASGTDYLITNQSTKVYYYTTGGVGAWNDSGVAVTASKVTRWAQAGKGALKTLYGVNGVDSITKVVEVASTPTGSAVANSPTTATAIIQHKNRLFALAPDGTLSFTEALAYETWNTGVNTIDIAPGKDGAGVALAIWGDSLFIFKEFGVYVLPNADSVSPKSTWVILRTDAATGTQSADSVQTTKAGIMYLGSDINVRLISPDITFSTGEYTLGGSGSPIISQGIKDDFELLSRANLNSVSAIVHDDLYILSYQSTDAASSWNDITFFADTSKWLNWPNIPQPQPYWGNFTGFDYQYFANQNDGGRIKLYGVKGKPTIGQVHETLNETIHNDNGDGIDAWAILGWMPVDSASSYKNLKQLYMVADTENWDIEVTLGAYKYRQSLSENGEGLKKTYSTQSLAGVGVVGTAVVGSSIVGNEGISSNKFNYSLKGYYFKIEFRNQNADQFTRIDKIILYYRPIKNK